MKRTVILLSAGAALVAVLIWVGVCFWNEPAQSPAPTESTAPSISVEELEQEVDFELAEKDGNITTAESGEVVIVSGHASLSAASNPALSTTTPDKLWELPFDDVFTLPDAVLLPDGSLGKLNIPVIGLEVAIYETDDEIEDMSVGIAHMKETSCWNGNVGLAGHNRGVNNNFGKLYTLKTGNSITLTTALGVREYAVTTSSVIDENDWSVLGRSEDNHLTLITCIDNQPTKRLCVSAVQK